MVRVAWSASDSDKVQVNSLSHEPPKMPASIAIRFSRFFQQLSKTRQSPVIRARFTEDLDPLQRLARSIGAFDPARKRSLFSEAGFARVPRSRVCHRARAHAAPRDDSRARRGDLGVRARRAGGPRRLHRGAPGGVADAVRERRARHRPNRPEHDRGVLRRAARARRRAVLLLGAVPGVGRDATGRARPGSRPPSSGC